MTLTFGSISAQDFNLKSPDITELSEKVKTTKEDVIYLFLKSNYQITSGKRDIQYHEINTTDTCTFKQEFGKAINYSFKQCEEAAGALIHLRLPKADRKALTNWIEKIYLLYQSDNEPMEWRNQRSEYRPGEDVPGCYFTIKENENSTLVTLYCGC